MQAEERQQRIENHLQKVEFASLDELSQQVGASTSTVRRDLTVLEAKGSLRRTHGGARAISPKSDEYAFSVRDSKQADAKTAIGQACSQLISPDETVIVDAGTTTYHAACELESKTPQIITNSLPVANHYASASQIEVVVTGGVIYPRLGVLVGPLAVEAFSHIHADVAIMSGGGITPEGISNSHVLLIDIQRAMIKAAKRVIFCFDHTKLGRQSVAHLCTLEGIDEIITDSQASPEIVDSIRSKGLKVIVADEN